MSVSLISKKTALAAAAFLCLSFVSDYSKAESLLDCTGLEGYKLQVCEQQKALAEDNSRSNEKAAKKASKQADKADKAQEEVASAKKESEQKISAETEKLNEATSQASKADSEYWSHISDRNKARNEMNEAINRGDTAAAQEARNRMVEANSKAEEAQDRFEEAEKNKKKAEKEISKAQKDADKAAEKAQKEAEKAEKEKIKAAEKAEKNANKDLKKAQKEYDKLQETCVDKPEKCDVEALQAAKINLDAAQANADAATKAREDLDGTTEANFKNELGDMVAADRAASMEDPQVLEDIDALSDIPIGTGTEGDEKASADTKASAEKLDANGNPVSQQRCAEAKDNIFKYIACKAMTTLADVRVIVYTLAGFGLVAFAFAAIFNKISWKHLANLCIALFILSMMTPFISYFTYNDGTQITFGNYLPAGFTNIVGSEADKAQNCDTSKGDVCPDVNVDTSAKDTKWSWKDLKNTVKSGINAAKTAYNTYKTVKNTVETTVEQAKKIGTAIKNSGGGLDGVLDTLGQVATASDTIFSTVKSGANAVVANTASIANDIQTAGKSTAELKFDKENETRIAELEKKLAAGNLSKEQQEWAKAELEQRKAAVDSNKVTDWANTKGKEITDSINKVASTASTASKITRTASSAADQGSNIGGDFVGAVFGLATAAGETIGTIEENKQAKIDAAEAEAKKKAEAEAKAKRQEEIRQNNKELSQGKVWDNSFNAQMDQTKPTVSEPISEPAADDGNKTSSTTTNIERTPSGQINLRDDDAPDGTVTTWSESHYDPLQDAWDNTYGRNKETQPETSDITRTYTTTSGGSSANSEGVGSLPESTTKTTVTIHNAKQNSDGTVVIQDDNGTYGTFDEKGNLLSTTNYVTGEQKNYQNQNNADWNNLTPSWGQF